CEVCRKWKRLGNTVVANELGCGSREGTFSSLKLHDHTCNTKKYFALQHTCPKK
ncbi:hypothetical protein ANANG_G00134340, partial [Anguilla anguilla]